MENERIDIEEPLILEIKRQINDDRTRAQSPSNFTVFKLTEQNQSKTVGVQADTEAELIEDDDNITSSQRTDQLRKNITSAEVITLYDESPSSEPRDSSEIHFEVCIDKYSFIANIILFVCKFYY